jgi:hypothetical protein
MEQAATSFVRLISCQPSSFAAYLVVYLLTVDLELKSVVDLTIVYQNDLKGGLAEEYKGSFIGKDGILFKLAGISNIFNFARSSNPAITIILVLGLLGLFIWLTWWCFVPKSTLSFTAGEGESEKKIGLQTKVASFVLHYFEYFFILSVTVFVQSVTCFSTETQIGRNSNQNTIIRMPNKQENQETITTIESSYNDLNVGITCKSITHIYLVIFTSLLLLLSVLFKVVNHRLLSYRPNPDFMLSKFGMMDNIHTFLVISLLVLKTIIKSFPHQLAENKTFYFAIACVLGVIDLVAQTSSHPFYSKSANRFRYIETLLISLVSLHVILPLVSDSVFVRNEIYLILSCCLCIVIVLRIADNIEIMVEEQSLLERKKDIDNRKVLSFVYMGIKYINACLLGDQKVINSREFQKVIFYFMTENQNDMRGDVTVKKWNLARSYMERTSSSKRLESHQLAKPELLTQSTKGRLKALKFSESSRSDPKANKIEYAKPELESLPKKIEPQKTQEPDRIMVKQMSRKPSDISASEITKFSIEKSRGAINNLDDNHGNRISINGVPIGKTMAKDMDKIESSFSGVTGVMQGVEKTAQRLDDMINEAKNIKIENNDKREKGNGYSMTTMSNQERSTQDATLVLFNSFSESKSNSVDLVVKMLDDMIEEHLFTLLNTPGVEFRTLFVLLNTYVYFKLNYLGAAYQVSIKIREIEHRFSRISSDRLRVSNKLSFKLLYSMIKMHIKNNLETGNLIMPHMRSFMSFDAEQLNTVKLYDVTQFINIYGEIKKLMKEMVVNKSKFLQALMINGADFKEISQQTNIFTSQKKKIRKFFKVMIKKSKAKFTPLMMIYGTYLFYIEQNIAEARKVLRQFVAKKFFFDLRYISDISLSKDQEMMTIGCSMEKETFHTINMVSCNVYYQLEYDAFELIGQDLSILVPKPLSDYHKQLLMPHNMTGILFERKGLTETPIKKKNGYLTTCKASFRMNYRINTCLEVFAVFVFDRENQNLKNLIVVDESMMITEISEVCTDHFEKGTFIYQYNRKFYQIFEDLNYVSHFRLKHGSIELKELMKDNDILEKYNTYFRFLDGENIEVKDKNGVRRFINIRIIVIYMASVQKFIRYVEYDLLKEEDVKNTKINTDLMDEKISEQLDLTFYNTEMRTDLTKKYDYSKLDKAEVKVKELIDYLNDCTLLQGPSKTLMTSMKNSSLKPSKATSVKSALTPKTDSKFNLKNNKSVSHSKSRQETTKKDGTKILLTKPSNISDITKDKTRIDKSRLSVFSNDTATAKMTAKDEKVVQSPENSQGQNQEEEEESSKRRYYNTSGMEKKKRGGKMSEDSQKRRSTSYRRIANRDSKFHQYMTILHEKIRTLKSNIMFAILIGYLLMSLVFQALIGSEKYSIQHKVANDLMSHISTIDDVTLALDSALKTLDFLDFNRNVFKGVVPKDLLAEYGFSDLLEVNSKADDQLLYKMQNSINTANIKMIDSAFSKEEYTSSFSFSPQVKGLLFNQSTSRWQTINVTFRSLGSLLQPMIDSYSLRSLPTILEKGPLDNPEGDALEQTLRKNLGGEETRIIYELTKNAEHYFEYASSFHKSFLLTSELLAICSILLVAIIVLLYAFLLRLKMKSVFLTVFQFRVNFNKEAR